MNYEETLNYLYTSLPMFSRVGSAAYKKDLTNIRHLCSALSNPQEKFKSIHVAGTNGKGSTSHMLAAVLTHGGFRTGLYTSPHVYDFRERIRIGGEWIDQDFVVDFVRRIKPIAEEIHPSFFEITVAMAFDYFASSRVEYAIVEVGLGGRLDSTNIVTPVVSVVTNIGWDHMNLLGNTLQEIAGEKAGIIKTNVPVVIGERQVEVEDVFLKTAASKNSPIFFASDNFKVVDYKLGLTMIQVSVKHVDVDEIRIYTLDLPGLYQRKNLLTVLQALEILGLRSTEYSDIREALSRTKFLTDLRGRWEMISENPRTVLEVAHNKEGVGEMLNHLQAVSFNNLHIVIGTVSDKDPTPILEQLPPTASYYFTKANIPRALNENDLRQKAQVFGLKGESYAGVNDAVAAARSLASQDDVIVVCGSIFLVAEVQRP